MALASGSSSSEERSEEAWASLGAAAGDLNVVLGSAGEQKHTEQGEQTGAQQSAQQGEQTEAWQFVQQLAQAGHA